MKLAEMPKSYVVSVDYKGSWPHQYCVDWHYHSLSQALRHISWLGKKMVEQNGKSAIRKNVVRLFLMTEELRSKNLDKRLPALAKFTPPKARELPEGGVRRVPVMEL